MEIIRDIPLIEKVYTHDVILVPMGTNNGMNHGFQLDIKLNFPNVALEEKKTPFCDKRKLGTTYEIKEQGIVFCMCYIHDGGYQKKTKEDDYVNYDAVKNCLLEVKEKYKGKNIASPVIGCTKYDGNGNKERIFSLINETFSDICVYDYSQLDLREEVTRGIYEARHKMKRGEITKEEYEKIKNKLTWQDKHGTLTPMPEDYKYIRKRRVGVLTVKKADLEKRK